MIKENEIRPQKIFDKLLLYSKKDVSLFKDKKNWRSIKCPACSGGSKFVFKKNSFQFRECKNCATLYVSPRPDKKYFDNFYQKSKTAEYFKKFYKITEKSRKIMLWRPKVAELLINKDVKKIKNKIFVDIGGGSGIFADELKRKSKIDTIIIEPSEFLSKVAIAKGYTVVRKLLSEIKKNELKTKKKRIFTSFELVEHLHDCKIFFKQVYNIMKSGELFIFTTLSGIGIDILSLKQKSKSVFPPHHINFFNPYSISLLLKKLKFKSIKVTTPGKLDVDILQKNLNFIKSDIIIKLLKFSQISNEQIQKSIASLCMSSHMMIVCRK